MLKKRDQEEKERGEVLRKEQKPYVKPKLTEYGHIEKLTQSAGTGGAEGFARKRIP